MSSPKKEEMRARGLVLLKEQRQKQREAELARLAAPATTGDIEALGNRINSAVSKLISAVDRLHVSQVAVLQQLRDIHRDL